MRISLAEFAAVRFWAMEGHHLRAWARHGHELALDRAELRVLALEERAAARGGRLSAGGIQVIQALGVLSQRGGMSTCGTDSLGDQIDQAMADPGVSAIVLEWDSPGGEVYGVDELASKIRGARDTKPIVSHANSLAASAAYYAACQATELMVTPSGEVGSIGVYGVHEDWSGAVDQAGVKVTFVSAGEGKTDGNPYEPLSDAARADMQASVDGYYSMFTTAVAKGRKQPVERVRSEWKAKMYSAKKAMEIGMADSIGTRADAIRRAATLARAGMTGGSGAELNAVPLTASEDHGPDLEVLERIVGLGGER